MSYLPEREMNCFNNLTKQDASSDKENQLFLVQGKNKDLPDGLYPPMGNFLLAFAGIL